MALFFVFWGGSTAFSYCRDRNYGAAPRTLRPTRTVIGRVTPTAALAISSGVGGEKYLFTGDTMFPAGDGTWSTFLVPGRGSAADLRSSLELLATVQPDLVISSAFGGDTAIETVDDGRWRQCIAEALATVPS